MNSVKFKTAGFLILSIAIGLGLCIPHSLKLENEVLDEESKDGQKQGLNSDRIKVSGKWLIDSYGRVRIFHGINTVGKAFPWYHEENRNLSRLKLYQNWGFNAVRLGIMWSGVFPNEGSINHSYVDIMQDMVQRFKNHGMYTLLDMHQDVISSLYKSYDGVPLWLVEKFPPPRHPYPWPLKEVTFWEAGYLTEAVSEAFQHLYDNTARALDHMAEFWTHVATVFQDQTSILGYEIINEPWAGDIYTKPGLLLPGETGRQLLPVYDVINDAIRKIDNHTLLFYEPATYGIYFNDHYLGPGFERVPGGDAYKDLSVFSYHHYCWLLNSGDKYQPYPLLKRIICDGLAMPSAFRQVDQFIDKVGGSAFLTEFGAYNITGPNTTFHTEAENIMRYADKHLQSWTYWACDFFELDGNLKWHNVELFARTYAQAIAGIPTDMFFDPETLFFSLTYDHDPTINAPTEIFVPPLKYPNGPEVSVSEGFSARFDAKLNILFVNYVQGSSEDKVPCHVVIYPQ